MKLLRRVIAAGLILSAMAVTVNTSNYSQIQRNKDTAHEIAEMMRSEGHPESHPVILACQQWWREEDAKEESTPVFTTREQRAEYPEAAYVWQLLKEAGLSDVSAAAILGNAMAESGGQTLNINVYQDVGGYWGAWAMSKTYYPGVVGQGADVQVRTILDTLDARFFGITDVREAARWFSDNWERPAVWSEKRADNAELALRYFGGSL